MNQVMGNGRLVASMAVIMVYLVVGIKATDKHTKENLEATTELLSSRDAMVANELLGWAAIAKEAIDRRASAVMMAGSRSTSTVAKNAANAEHKKYMSSSEKIVKATETLQKYFHEYLKETEKNKNKLVQLLKKERKAEAQFLATEKVKDMSDTALFTKIHAFLNTKAFTKSVAQLRRRLDELEKLITKNLERFNQLTENRMKAEMDDPLTQQPLELDTYFSKGKHINPNELFMASLNPGAAAAARQRLSRTSKNESPRNSVDNAQV